MHKKGGARCCKCHGGRGRWGTSCYDSPENCCKKKRSTTKRSTTKRSTTKRSTTKRSTKKNKKTKKQKTRKLFLGLF